jgi:hypothetical protein
LRVIQEWRRAGQGRHPGPFIIIIGAGHFPVPATCEYQPPTPKNFGGDSPFLFHIGEGIPFANAKLGKIPVFVAGAASNGGNTDKSNGMNLIYSKNRGGDKMA